MNYHSKSSADIASFSALQQQDFDNGYHDRSIRDRSDPNCLQAHLSGVQLRQVECKQELRKTKRRLNASHRALRLARCRFAKLKLALERDRSIALQYPAIACLVLEQMDGYSLGASSADWISELENFNTDGGAV